MLVQVERAAQNDTPVLLVGERDTGKRTVARLLHATSPRAGNPFVVADCARQHLEDLGDDLFRAHGLLARAEGGTLLLSGVQHLGPEHVESIVRGLIARIAAASSAGSPAPRVVATCEADPMQPSGSAPLIGLLQEAFRFEVIAVPSLRERSEDVPLLGAYVADAARRRTGERVNTEGLLSALRQYPWPGNLGELEQRILQYVSNPPPDAAEAAGANALAIPVDRIAATLILHDGTRREVVLPHDHCQTVQALFEAEEPFLAVKEGDATRIYARSALACVIVGAASESEDDVLPYNRRRIRVRLRSGTALEGELRYVVVEGRGRVSDALNESGTTFCVHASDAAQHIAKAHVLCVEEC
jgi:DNA-binding NtrC family response regulator